MSSKLRPGYARKTERQIGVSAVIQAAVAMSLCLLFPITAGAQSSSTFEEQYKLIKAPNAVTRLGGDLFGDDVNLYNGAVTFTQTDVSLPGNNSLSVSVGRRIVAGQHSYGNRAFGKWDLDIPHMHGTFALGTISNKKGWNVGDALASKLRCTNFGAPAYTNGANGDSEWAAEEFWQGNFMYVPGTGDQQMLKRAWDYTLQPAAFVVDGVTVNQFPVVTTKNWSIGCLPKLANDSTVGQTMGEGFVAVSPDGTRYVFNHLISHLAPLLSKAKVSEYDPLIVKEIPFATNAKTRIALKPRIDDGGGEIAPQAARVPLLQTAEYWLMPTKIIDRFGNTVTYTYDPVRPANLMTIVSKDRDNSSKEDRTITFAYVTDAAGPTNRIKSVFDGTRTWNYSYHGTGTGTNLDQVTLPDSSKWDFSQTEGMFANVAYMPGSECSERSYPYPTVRQGTMVHPSGASGKFTLIPVEHGRSDVPQDCRERVLVTPIYFHSNSLINKEISGPGIAPMSWNYAYGPANGSFSPCSGCATTKTINVTDPKGQVTKYTFGNQYRVSEGKIQQIDEGWNGSSAMRTTVTGYALPGTAGAIRQLGTSDVMNDTSTEIAPARQRTITQQGVDFKWEVTQFDSVARPSQIRRSSSLQTSRDEVTTYFDKPTIWVLDQVDTVTVAGKLQVNNDYYDSNAMLEKVYTSGKPEPDIRYSYYGDGTLYTTSDALSHTTTFSNYRRGIAQNIGRSQRPSATPSAVRCRHGENLPTSDHPGARRRHDHALRPVLHSIYC
jgi:hypothetical protein